MQIMISKNLTITLAFLLVSTFSIYASSLKQIAYAADSLYQAGNFVSAKKIYQTLYTEKKIKSPTLLLRLAAIAEREKDHAHTLFYLHQLYELTGNNTVRLKIEKLAEEENIPGYTYSDFYVLLKKIVNQKEAIFYSLLGLGLFLLLLGCAYLLWKDKILTGIYIGSVVLLCTGFFFHYNAFSSTKAIINRKQVALMLQPNSGSPVVNFIQKGGLCTIEAYTDRWVKVKVGSEKGYVPQHTLQKIP